MMPRPRKASDLTEAARRLPKQKRQLLNRLLRDGLFMSHTGRDAAFIRDNLLPLVRQSFRQAYFFQSEVMPGSDSYVQMVGQALLSCRRLLVAVSQNSLLSQWMAAEIELATQRRMPTLVCCLDNTPPGAIHRRLRPRNVLAFWKPSVVTISLSPDVAPGLNELSLHLQAFHYVSSVPYDAV